MKTLLETIGPNYLAFLMISVAFCIPFLVLVVVTIWNWVVHGEVDTWGRTDPGPLPPPWEDDENKDWS